MHSARWSGHFTLSDREWSYMYAHAEINLITSDQETRRTVLIDLAI